MTVWGGIPLIGEFWTKFLGIGIGVCIGFFIPPLILDFLGEGRKINDDSLPKNKQLKHFVISLALIVFGISSGIIIGIPIGIFIGIIIMGVSIGSIVGGILGGIVGGLFGVSLTWGIFFHKS